MVSYYNEIDPYAAQWLRNLITNKLIADGDVDERSIRDVAAADLHGYTQCHFFAGIGVWSHALRLAGWPDDRPVWTGSCPCQPFSAAGKGAGFADDRHLWPEFYRLIAECAPPVVFGEQVASKDGLGWIDAVRTDLEVSGYAVGMADMCAAGVGAPHIRQRLWFVGERLDNTAGARHARAFTGAEGEARDEARLRLSGEGRGSGGLADTDSTGSQSGQRHDQTARHRHSVAAEGSNGGLADAQGQRYGQRKMGDEDSTQRASSGGGEDKGLRQSSPSGASGDERLADACNDGSQGRVRGGPNEGWQTLDGSAGRDGADCRPRPTDGHWRAADWLCCRDGKWRPVEPGTFPLAHGAPARVGRLRAYGNAIVPQVAAEVIGAYLDARP